jgi:hypothetical protein
MSIINSREATIKDKQTVSEILKILQIKILKGRRVKL